MSKPVITGEALETALAEHPEWAITADGKAIEKTFKFDDFKQAFSFMTSGALSAEALDHHPEWFNVYNRVQVKLTTHDSGGITELDLSLAAALDKAAS
ncbi:MAG: 4a-hydroxytetrahydrobiopterin dehydratase [Pseudomonadota bacterium]